MTEENRGIREYYLAHLNDKSLEFFFMEFPLYYGQAELHRIKNDVSADAKVFQAEGIWSLLWTYLKVNIFGIRKKKPKGLPRVKLPKY